MKESFPVDEFRSYEKQKELLQRQDYQLKVFEQEGQVVGFCAYYIFDEFIYIEHLACKEWARGLGIGTKLVQEVLDGAGELTVILEVEVPMDEVTKRRVHFYERLGFVLNTYPHYQPPLNETTGIVELKIMSSFKGLKEEEQKQFRRILNQKVYGVDRDFNL
ncbi:MAG: GNAT family N-acetyltransferase [Turicibacter sp.]|nr:GNAT family N-acetyltransferase [Turicibacter sp.]